MTSQETEPTVYDRFAGALMGLAVGDALGTTLEFSRPGSFDPVTDMVGGGPFGLRPGEWTDDTSMALCLAASLTDRDGFDPADQMERFSRWRRTGYMSSNGMCFDIGGTVRAAISRYEATGEPFSGSTAESSAGNGSLMRLAPVPMFYYRSPREAIERSGESSKTTHGTAMAVDSCRYFGGLLAGAIGGASKERLLEPLYAPVPGYWDDQGLDDRVAAVARGSFAAKEPPEIRGSGFVIACLEAALWAFATTDSFDGAVLEAVNLGDDADTTGAVCGQIAGAFYGASSIPASWREKLARRDVIEDLIEKLFSAASSVEPSV